MIDCPICHVPNDDDARFCAECGQRLQQPTPQPGPPPAVPPGTFTGAFNQINAPAEQPASPAPAPSPTPEHSPAVAASKLHSPLLGASSSVPSGPGPGASDPISSNNPELDRLRRMTRDNEPPAGVPTGAPPEPDQGHSQPPRKLRSPLLAQEEFDDDEPTSFGGQQGGGQAGSHGSAFPHRQSAQLRSPLLGNDEGGEQHPPDKSTGDTSRGGKMRSPLLGGGRGGAEPEYDDYQNNNQGPPRGGNTGSGKKLRSRMLSGGGDDYGGSNFEEDYEEDPYADEDNPNMLRSPLLAAKRPRGGTGSHSQPTPGGPLPTVPPAPGAPSTIQPSAPHIAPQPAQAQQMTSQGPPQAPSLPPQPAQAPPAQAPAPQSQSAGGGWAGPGQPGAPPSPGPRAAADLQQGGPAPNSEPLQSDAAGPQAGAPGRFQGTGTWYSDKNNTASGAADPQSLSGQQPNYGNISPPSPSGGPLWNPADSGLPSQSLGVGGPSSGVPDAGGSGPGAAYGVPGSSPSGPGFTPGGPAAPGASRGGYPEEDYAKLRRPAGEPTPANLGTVPTNTKPSGSVNHPGLENLLPGATKEGSDTARGGAGKGESSKPIKRTGSRLLSNVAEENENAPSPYPDDNRLGGRSNLAPQQSAPSGGPILLILGGISTLCALMKLYVISAYMPTQFWQFPGFVVDQISSLLLLVGLMVFCFMPRR